MSLKTTPYRGTRDLFPSEKKIQNYLFSKMKEVSELFGFLPYDGPLLEEVELYSQKSGEEIVKNQIYSFHDRGNRHVAIRPEMTPTVARMVAQVYQSSPLPLKWYSIPNLMRYERPQKGRLREHWQLNCDIFGEESVWGETEIIDCAISLFKSFGANSSQFKIKINDRKVIDYFYQHVLQVGPELFGPISKVLDKKRKISLEDFNQELETLGLNHEKRNLLQDFTQTQTIDELEALFKQAGHQETAPTQNLRNLLMNLESIGKKDYVEFSAGIIRGFDYYTGIIFEIFDLNPDNPRALCGGGRYDHLLSIFGKPATPAVGFGLGDVTLRDFLETHGLLPETIAQNRGAYLSYGMQEHARFTQKIAVDLRNKNIPVFFEVHPSKIKRALTQAQNRQYSYLIYVGEQEYDNQSFIVKNLKTTEQKTFFVNKSEPILDFIK